MVDKYFYNELEKISSAKKIHKFLMPASEGAVLGGATGAILIPAVGKDEKQKKRARRRNIIIGTTLGAGKRSLGSLIQRGYAKMTGHPYKDLLL
tara:strand:+ start:375 stop:656 length:282 start_codon:yes stop_codon:yes gene_type:complete